MHSGQPNTTSQLLVTGGNRTVNKAVSLIFDEPRSRPIVAAKMARVPASAQALVKEAARLEAVRSRTNTEGVPRLLFNKEIGRTYTIGVTAFTGSPMFMHLNRKNYRRFAIKATDWLIGLAGAPWPRSRDLWRSRLVQSVLDKFECSYGRVACYQELEKAEQAILSLTKLPLVCEQRDFSPWNILLTPKEDLAVLDWESAEPEGLPGLDLVYFLTYLAFFLDGACDEVSYKRSYRIGNDSKSFTGRLNSECLRRYGSALNLQFSCFRPLRLLTWMLHADSEYQRMVADVDGEPTTEMLEHSLFLNLWKEELRLPAVIT